MDGEVGFVKRQRDLVKLASKTACAGKQSIEKQSLSRLNRPIQIQDKYKSKTNTNSRQIQRQRRRQRPMTKRSSKACLKWHTKWSQRLIQMSTAKSKGVI